MVHVSRSSEMMLMKSLACAMGKLIQKEWP